MYNVSMPKRVYQFLVNSYRQERSNKALWYPVLIAVGILLHYANFKKYIYFILLTLILRKKVFFIIIGLLAIQIRVWTINTEILDKPIYISNCTATIQEINYKDKSIQIILKDLHHRKLLHISKVRLKVYKLDSNIKSGDIVLFSGKLLPPPIMPSPYAYNFARFAYFDGISAVGYITNIKLAISKPKKFLEGIDIVRNYIAKSFIETMGATNGNIASALIVGKRSGIDNETMTIIRNSGLAHLLAISGLHLTIVAFFFFTIFRKLCALSIFLATKYNIKKWAAIAGIIFSGFYLILSGMSISAQRAFIMVSIVLIAILIDRNSSTMRSVSVAATLILLLEPESILKPSFQMSFAAVIGLCAFFEVRHIIYVHHIFYRVFDYLTSIILSSLVASLATTPYTVYHFNHLSLGGVISNLLAIPLTTIIILPSGIISAFFMPCGLGYIPSMVMSKGIDIILYISKIVGNLTYSSIPIHAFNNTAVLVITFGFLWLCLWQQKWCLLGIPVIFLGLVIGMNYKIADIFINEKMTAVKGDDGKLYFLAKPRKNFVNSVWLAQNAQDKIYTYAEHHNTDRVNISCSASYCEYYNNGKAVLFLYAPTEMNFEKFDYVIQLKDFPVAHNNKIISYQQMKNGCFIWLSKGEVINLDNGIA